MNEFELNVGAHVHCADGRCGTLAKVAIAPETWQVTHLVVEEGVLLKRARVFPFSLLVLPPAADEGAPGALHFDVESAKLEDYPVYHEETVETLSPEQAAYGGAAGGWREVAPYGAGPAVPPPVATERVHHGVPGDTILVDHRTSVEGYDGGAGKLDRLLVSGDDGAITAIVVQQGLLFTTRRVLPIALARSISEESIFVEASADELKQLPEYALPAAAPAPAAGAQTVTEDPPQETPAAQPAGASNDAGLTNRVARALYDDPRTADAVVEVIDERGVITLDGEVDSPAVREAAAEVAAAQPGVTTVVNLLRIRP